MIVVAVEQPGHPNQTHREYLEPTWPIIEAEIRALDGQTRKNLWIEHIDQALYDWCSDGGGECTCDHTSNLIISGGDNGHYAIAAELTGPDRMTGHRLEGPNQPFDAVPLDIVVRVVRHFIATAALDPTQPWITW
jgi:hypothetical protein